MSADGEASGPAPGPDPWCTWCDETLDFDAVLYQIRGERDGTWPPVFCSEQCASAWGCAAHQDRIISVVLPDPDTWGEEIAPEAGLAEFGDRLAAAKAIMLGEADELAARRPHEDAHLYDIEAGLRHHATEEIGPFLRGYYRR